MPKYHFRPLPDDGLDGVEVSFKDEERALAAAPCACDTQARRGCKTLRL
jgi:hypothetical protein